MRFTESNENYARQHTVEDTIEGVSGPYLVKNARVNAAGAASLALAPPAPGVIGDRGRDDYVFGVAAVGPGGHVE